MTTMVDARVSPGAIPWSRLSGIFQRGVRLRAETPTPVIELLTGQLAIDPAYVRDRIATVFLDRQVVDDLERTVVTDGSTLTLSAAMPGLVGATLRRGGFYAAMRSEISWTPRGDVPAHPIAPSGMIRLKLFNLILREIGPAMLDRGVVLDRTEAVALLGEGWCAERGVPDGGLVALRIPATQATGD